MFQPETEDMLPRCAPTPSVPLDMNTATIVRPTVPEVSILIGAQQADSANSKTAPNDTPNQPQQTYAAWKRQLLPKVSFPPAGAEVYSINGHVVGSNIVSGAKVPMASSTTAAPTNGNITSNLYPLRPVTANVTQMPIIANSNAAASLNGITTQMQQYRRSIEQPLCSQENFQRRSFDACTTTAQTYRSNLDVLTICAGTQTEAALISDSPRRESGLLEHLATKEDFQKLFTMFGDMRMEQQRLMNTMESFLVQQTRSPQISITRQNACTQYNVGDCYESKEKQVPIAHQQYEVIEEYNTLPSSNGSNGRYKPHKELPAFALELPRQPTAQSTAYQAPTPRNTIPTTAEAMPNKPSTEKSMLMNELALKYLPNEQLNVLLQELNIAPAAQQKAATPLRPIENIEKQPSDMSNASYKYLKKYRLLPEEYDEGKELLTPVRSPITQGTRQQQQEQSPYQPQQQPRASPRVLTLQSPMLDLEHIRRQPKLI
ncbi:PREDICTED: uncharacterized protein LOC108360544 [Rhagoletis zephyria]|uniref:uncharacterized protein LOC108360544 n=1 Tax=Rhagoletis zephyria TaxID=28612 RepID=UPI0008116DA5|nr:PREDICTED: uncharacterized protein LOC108360544 [Rhagoletis zephyria]